MPDSGRESGFGQVQAATRGSRQRAYPGRTAPPEPQAQAVRNSKDDGTDPPPGLWGEPQANRTDLDAGSASSTPKETAKAPGLGDIPLVGYLFGGETDLKRWDDLVVTVTPHFYVSSQTDLHLTATHQQLIEVVEGGRGVAIPSTPYFYDQWLLDADK